jgi:hypothetical protein
MFVLDKLFWPSLMFEGKAGAYPSEAPVRYSALGYAHGLGGIIRLGLKGLPETKTLADYEHSCITDIKHWVQRVQYQINY